MTVIEAIVVEDEELILSEIRTMVQATGFINVARAYTDPLEALGEAESLRPQLAFIDIGLPEMDGITLAEKLLERIPALQVVFITAYNRYAVKAFELNALDYLLKPIDQQRFQTMVRRIANTVSEQKQQPQDLLEIQCFGGLEVKVGGQGVKWVRSKAEELFCYLLVNHGIGVHKEALIEVLWPDYDPRRALPLLQTSVCKLRNIFSPLAGKVQLNYAASKYCLTISDAVCDYFFVEDVLGKWAKAGIEDYALVERAGRLIRRGFLKGQGYLWAMEKEEQMRNQLCSVLRILASLCLSNQDWAGAAKLLKLLLEEIPYDEEGNNNLLNCYAQLNNGAGIIHHYQWLQRVLQEDYDMKPAVSTRRLFYKLYGEKYGQKASEN
jgi:two-component system LytT family response regulator